MIGTGKAAKPTWRNRTAEHRSHGAKLRGTIMGVPAPKLVGVSDAVLMANNQMARDARRAEIEWKRTLRRRRTR